MIYDRIKPPLGRDSSGIVCVHLCCICSTCSAGQQVDPIVKHLHVAITDTHHAAIMHHAAFILCNAIYAKCP